MNSILQCLIKQREIYGNIDTSRAHLRDLWKQSSEFLAHAVAGDKKIEKREKGLVIATMEEIAKLESLSNHFQNSGSSKGLLKPAMKYMNSISGPMEEFINSLDEQHQNFDKQEKILENCSQLVRKLNNTELTKESMVDSVCSEIKNELSSLVGDQESKFLFQSGIESLVLTQNNCRTSGELLDTVLALKDRDVWNMYQLTHKYFSSPRELLSQLCTRYCSVLEEASNDNLKMVQNRREQIIEFTRMWIEDFFHSDVSPHSQLLENFIHIIQNSSK